MVDGPGLSEGSEFSGSYLGSGVRFWFNDCLGAGVGFGGCRERGFGFVGCLGGGLRMEDCGAGGERLDFSP